MKKIIVGRAIEKDILQEIYQSKSSDFVSITGRRRVGKTYLVKTYFDGNIDFDFSGVLNASLQQQLQNFHYSLSRHFRLKKADNIPHSWLEAFQMLSRYLEDGRKKKKRIIFIDELPWLDTHRSGFMAALDWFWNSWAAQHDVLLIVCGSATSWMMNHLINSRGGLHNRVTKRIHLAPFSLAETEVFLRANSVALTRYHILQLYMALGGIPHYLKEVRKGESAMQAINRICFQKNGLLINEFNNLYNALFKNAGAHTEVVFALASKQKGLTRNEILAITKLKDGGTFTKILEELECCNFIVQQSPFGKAKKDALYRLADEFSLFYIRFMHKKKSVNWQQLSATQAWKIWSGYAFENVCIKHVNEIKKALGIAGVFTEVSSFTYKATKNLAGAQVDLIIDRNDGAINICEAKFYDKPFTLNKQYAAELKNKVDVFRQVTKSSKTLFPTLITVNGFTPNTHSVGFIQQGLGIDDLFSL